MDIGRIDGIQGSVPVNPLSRAGRAEQAYGASAPASSDRVSISPEASLVSRALQLPEVRADRVAEVRDLIQQGRFDTVDRLEKALDQFLRTEGQ